MSRTPKTARARVLPRKTSGARNFPAWIDSETRAIALPATAEPRVRDSLVLRIVARGITVHPRESSDVPRAC